VHDQEPTVIPADAADSTSAPCDAADSSMQQAMVLYGAVIGALLVTVGPILRCGSGTAQSAGTPLRAAGTPQPPLSARADASVPSAPPRCVQRRDREETP
jgi:hypothetical protein